MLLRLYYYVSFSPSSATKRAVPFSVLKGLDPSLNHTHHPTPISTLSLVTQKKKRKTFSFVLLYSHVKLLCCLSLPYDFFFLVWLSTFNNYLNYNNLV
jgi:hypothetical protein